VKIYIYIRGAMGKDRAKVLVRFIKDDGIQGMMKNKNKERQPKPIKLIKD